MKKDQINNLEYSTTEYTKLITELKDLKTKLEEAKQKYEQSEKEYSKLDIESIALYDEKEDIVKRKENAKQRFIESNNNELLTKILGLSSTILPVITIIITLNFIRNIPLIVISIISSFFLGIVTGKIFHKINEKKYIEKFRIQFENSNEYKKYQQQIEEMQNLLHIKADERDNLTLIKLKLNKEYNTIYQRVNNKFQQIEDFEKNNSSFTAQDEVEELKKEIHPGKIISYVEKNNINNKRVLTPKRTPNYSSNEIIM